VHGYIIATNNKKYVEYRSCEN